MSTPFRVRVLLVVHAIPHGSVASYGDVATLTGTPRAARAVGTVLRNHVQAGDEVPWHRVINSAGQISFKGDTARASSQRALLEDEGVTFHHGTVCDWPTRRWNGHGSPSFFEEPLDSGFVPPDFLD